MMVCTTPGMVSSLAKGGAAISADPRNDFDGDVFIRQATDLFIDGAVKSCITVVKAHDPSPGLLAFDQVGRPLPT